MTTEHQTTREEKAYRRFIEEKELVLSEVARTILSQAQLAAYAATMVHSYCFQPEEYDEAMEKMRRAATDLTDSEHKLLATFWRAALAAAASIDSEDVETLAGYKVYSGKLHYYYRMISGMVEKILVERIIAEYEERTAEREPEDLPEPPF